MENKILILVVCGVPCSGKSTFIQVLKNLKNDLNSCFSHKLNVNETRENSKEIIASQTMLSFPFEQILHLSYDNLMSHEVNKVIIENQAVYNNNYSLDNNKETKKSNCVDKDDTKLCMTFLWKNHRQLILKLLNLLIKRIKENRFNFEEFEKESKDSFCGSELKYGQEIIKNFLVSLNFLKTDQTTDVTNDNGNQKNDDMKQRNTKQENDTNKQEIDQNKQEINKNKQEIDINKRLIIVIDDNMWLRSMRRQVFNVARQNGISYAQIHIPPPSLSLLLDRNNNRGLTERVSVETIKNMIASFESPKGFCNACCTEGSKAEEIEKISEGENDVCNGYDSDCFEDEKVNKNENLKLNWERFSFCIECRTNDSNGQDSNVEYPFQEIFKLFTNSLCHPFTPHIPTPFLFQSRSVCLTNLLHQTDLILRKCVREEINHLKKTFPTKCSELQLLTRRINNCKTQVVSDIKNRRLLWPLPLESDVTAASNQPGSKFYEIVEEAFHEKMLQRKYLV